LKNKRRKRWLLLITAVLLLVAGYHLVARLYLEENKQIRSSLRDVIKEKYPDQANAVRARYGIKPANGEDSEGQKDSGKHHVILIHGLDDPGKVWMNLAPVLIKSGFQVWIMSYPNDQPIHESAQLFFEEMAILGNIKTENVSIVAHSMGGLVAREMLSSPGFAYSQAVLEEKVPTVANLIMIATPNHGSELAQFRLFGEFRDQLSNLFTGKYIWLESILDGAGEAGLDLLPSSPFLEALNGRPHPENVDMAVIAGVMSSWKSSDIEQFVELSKGRLPNNTHDSIAKLGNLLNAMAQGLGDGIVTVDSTKLNGFPLHIVPGTHLSIIRNIRENSQRVPPAVPVIVEYLNNEKGYGE